MVFESSTDNNNLFRADALRALCRIEDEVILTSPYVASCAVSSVGRLVARIQGTTCQNLTDDDVTAAEQVLITCSPFYFQGNFSAECLTSSCPDVPAECGIEIFIILHYLTHYKYLDPRLDPSDNNRILQYVQTVVNIPWDHWLDFYMESLFENDKLTNEQVRIAGIDSYVKFDVFNILIKRDMRYFLLAGAVIVVLMCLYLHSVLITFVTLIIVVFSLVLAYCLYFLVFRISFFPFVNVFSIIILIAIGADDVFIVYDTWTIMKALYPDKDIQFWFSKTMSHAALSVFVTSLTTATAFMANLVSEITNIRLFGIFAGTAILCNFILMITFIPAIIVLLEWFENRWLKNCEMSVCCDNVCDSVKRVGDFIFGKAFTFLVNKFWVVLLPVFAAVGAWGVIATTYTPKLPLPRSSTIRLFSYDNPIERYDKTLQHEFRYAIASMANSGLVVDFIWGVKALDNGNHFDPHDFGKLVLDTDFHISSVESWLWMKDFCHSMLNAPFSNPQYAASPCLMDLFEGHVAASCSGQANATCCGHTQPYPANIFDSCFKDFIVENEFVVHQTVDTPHFDSANNLVAYSLEIRSAFRFSGAFDEMDVFLSNLSETIHISSAPDGLDDGWFTSVFQFYDLQRALSSGTFVAIGVSLACAAAVMLLTSLNILLTLYAIFTIFLTIFFTVGVLVHLGWELNVLESIIITGSVGLSIDYAIHYGVAYRLAASPDREPRVQHALIHVGSSVAMASITTFLAGTSIYFSDVLGYQQLSVFLMVVMFSSWSFATFFFLSICRFIGPNGNCAQIPSPFSCCMKSKEQGVSAGMDDGEVAVVTADTTLDTIGNEKDISALGDVRLANMEDDVSKDEGYHEDSDRNPEPSEQAVNIGPQTAASNSNNNNRHNIINDMDTDTIPRDPAPPIPEANLSDIHLEAASYNNKQNASVVHLTNDSSNTNAPSNLEYQNPGYQPASPLRRISVVDVTSGVVIGKDGLSGTGNTMPHAQGHHNPAFEP